MRGMVRPGRSAGGEHGVRGEAVGEGFRDAADLVAEIDDPQLGEAADGL